MSEEGVKRGRGRSRVEEKEEKRREERGKRGREEAEKSEKEAKWGGYECGRRHMSLLKDRKANALHTDGPTDRLTDGHTLL